VIDFIGQEDGEGLEEGTDYLTRTMSSGAAAGCVRRRDAPVACSRGIGRLTSGPPLLQCPFPNIFQRFKFELVRRWIPVE
jgi:hypothetical protein